MHLQTCLLRLFSIFLSPLLLHFCPNSILVSAQSTSFPTNNISTSSGDNDLLLTYQITTYVLAGVLGFILLLIVSLVIQFRLVASARQREAASLALSALVCCRCFAANYHHNNNSGNNASIVAAGAKHPEQLEANARDPRRAPCDPQIQTTIIFLDVEAGSQLWEKCPAAMESAMKSFTVLTRNTVCEYKAYEVKSVGDGWMIAIVSPVAAVTMLVDLLYKRNDSFDGLSGEITASLKDAYGQIGPSSDAAVEKLYRERHSSSDDDDDDDGDDDSADDDFNNGDSLSDVGANKDKTKKKLSRQEIEEKYKKHQEKMRNKKKNKKHAAAGGAYMTAYTPASKLQKQQRDERKHKNAHTIQPGQLKSGNNNNHQQTTTNNNTIHGKLGDKTNALNNNNSNNYHHRSRYQQYLQQDVAILPSYNHQSYLRIRAGIDIGIVKIMHQSETNEFDYSGQVVERASRLEKLAHGHQCLVSSQIVEAVKMMYGGTKLMTKVEFQFLDEIDAGGSTTETPLQVFQVNVRDTEDKQDDDFFIVYPPLRVARAREVEIDDDHNHESINHQHQQEGDEEHHVGKDNITQEQHDNTHNKSHKLDGEESPSHHENPTSPASGMLSTANNISKNVSSGTNKNDKNNHPDLETTIIIDDVEDAAVNTQLPHVITVNDMRCDTSLNRTLLTSETNNYNNEATHLIPTSKTTSNGHNNNNNKSPSSTTTTTNHDAGGENNNNNDNSAKMTNSLHSFSITPEELRSFCCQFFFTALSTVPRDMRHKTLSALLLSWGVKVPQSIAGTGQNTRLAIAAMSAKKKAAVQAQDSLEAIAEMTIRVLKVLRLNQTHHHHHHLLVSNNATTATATGNSHSHLGGGPGAMNNSNNNTASFKSNNNLPMMIAGISTAQSFHQNENSNNNTRNQQASPSQMFALVQQLQLQNTALVKLSGPAVPSNNNNIVNNPNNRSDASITNNNYHQDDRRNSSSGSSSGVTNNIMNENNSFRMLHQNNNNNNQLQASSSNGHIPKINGIGNGEIIIMVDGNYAASNNTQNTTSNQWNNRHQNSNNHNGSNVSTSTSGSLEAHNNKLAIPTTSNNNQSSSVGAAGGGGGGGEGGSFSNYQQKLAHGKGK